MDKESLAGLGEWAELKFLEAFEGIPVRVDSELNDDEYYICISLGLSKRLERRKAKVSSPVPLQVPESPVE